MYKIWKKLIISFFFSILIIPVFWLSLEEKLDNFFEKKIDIKIENKYKWEYQKICTTKITIYNKIINKLEKYKKIKKYEKLIDRIVKYIKNREKNIEECKIQFYQDNNTPNPTLHFQIKNLDNLIKNTEKIKKRIGPIPAKLWKISYAKKAYKNNIFNIWNNWYIIKKSLYSSSSYISDILIKKFLEKYPDKNIIITKEDGIYKIYLYNLSDAINLQDIDPSLWLKANKDKLYKYFWIKYLDNFYYKKINDEGLIVGWTTDLGNNLVFFVIWLNSSYYPIKNPEDIIPFAVSHEDIEIITKTWDTYQAWISNWKVKIFNLWNKEIYTNIDKKLLGKILYSSFHKILIYNLDYTVNDMYLLLKLAEKFDNKDLKTLYRFITTHFSYAEDISERLQNHISSEQLEKDITTLPSLYKLWNVFYIIKHKKAICQSLSELLSVIALLNWQKADIVIGKIDYSHQVSKINQYYYDVTNDLWKKDHFQYFGMTKEQLLKYFKIGN